MDKKDIVFFSVNNWFRGRDYPDTPNFRKWLGNDLNQTFRSDQWAKENKLCIYSGLVDMSQNYTVSAPMEWVEKNCPELLTDKEYTYSTVIMNPKKMENGKFEYEEIVEKAHKKYSDFVYHPENGEDKPSHDRFDMPFRDYCEENFGSEYYETNYWGDEDDDDDDMDEDNE